MTSTLFFCSSLVLLYKIYNSKKDDDDHKIAKVKGVPPNISIGTVNKPELSSKVQINHTHSASKIEFSSSTITPSKANSNNRDPILNKDIIFRIISFLNVIIVNKTITMAYRQSTNKLLTYAAHLTDHSLARQSCNSEAYRNHRDLEITKDSYFFDKQFWCIPRNTKEEIARSTVYCNDTIYNSSDHKPFDHKERLSDPTTVFVFDGPNKNNKAMVAYNNDNKGTLLLFNVVHKHRSLGPSYDSIKYTPHTLHNIENKIETAILHPDDNTVVYATTLPDQTHFINISTIFNDQNIFTTVKIPFSLKKMVYLGKNTYLGLNHKGQIIKFWQENNIIKIAVQKILTERGSTTEDLFDDIAVDQEQRTEKGFNPCVAFLNKSREIFWSHLTLFDRPILYYIASIENKKDIISRFSLCNNEIGCLFGAGTDRYDHTIFVTYKIDYCPKLMIKTILNNIITNAI